MKKIKWYIITNFLVILITTLFLIQMINHSLCVAHCLYFISISSNIIKWIIYLYNYVNLVKV